jgi:hypothetical protein
MDIDDSHHVPLESAPTRIPTVVAGAERGHRYRGLGTIKEQQHAHPCCGRAGASELTKLGSILALEKLRLRVVGAAYDEFDYDRVARTKAKIDASNADGVLTGDVAEPTLEKACQHSICAQLTLSSAALVRLNEAEDLARGVFDLFDIHRVS